jgi:hypothetical protein
MKFPDADGSRYYGSYYWRDEEYLKLQQVQGDTLSKALLASDQIVEVTPLPSLLTPRQLSIPILCEAAVRMQADLLWVFRVSSDTYFAIPGVHQGQGEGVQHVRTGAVGRADGSGSLHARRQPERVELKQPTDFDLTETMRRAEQEAAAEALKIVAEDLVTFIKSVPRKGG